MGLAVFAVDFSLNFCGVVQVNLSLICPTVGAALLGNTDRAEVVNRLSKEYAGRVIFPQPRTENLV